MKKEGYKYNWEFDKEEFLLSDAPNPRAFYKKELGVFAPSSKTLRDNTSTWMEERRKLREIEQKEIQEAITEKKVKYATEQIEKMLQAKDSLVGLLKEYLSEGNAWEYVEYEDKITGERKKRIKLLISSAELLNIYKMVKTEVGEPITVPAEKDNKNKLVVPEGGIMGIKELMLKWKSGQIKQTTTSEGTTIEATGTTETTRDQNISKKVINMNTDGTERTEADTG